MGSITRIENSRHRISFDTEESASRTSRSLHFEPCSKHKPKGLMQNKMGSRGIEPRSSGPKPLILSIKLQALDFTIHNLFKTLLILLVKWGLIKDFGRRLLL